MGKKGSDYPFYFTNMLVNFITLLVMPLKIKIEL